MTQKLSEAPCIYCGAKEYQWWATYCSNRGGHRAWQNAAESLPAQLEHSGECAKSSDGLHDFGETNSKCLNCGKDCGFGFEPVAPVEAKDKCGKPAAGFIPRWGMSFACVLDKGHEGNCAQGGTCFKHGEYVGTNCPQWPNCISSVEAKECSCPTSQWIGSEPNDSTCTLTEEEHESLAVEAKDKPTKEREQKRHRNVHECLENALGAYQVTHCHAYIKEALKEMEKTESDRSQPSDQPTQKDAPPEAKVSFEELAELFNNSPLEGAVRNLCIEVMQYRHSWYAA